jgi:hypothetical protein
MMGAIAVVDEPKPDLKDVPAGEGKKTPELVPEVVVAPIKTKRMPANLAQLRKVSIERGKKTDEAILSMLHDWARNSASSWGTILNLKGCLECRGITLSVDTIRDHVMSLAKKGRLCVERIVFDPKGTFKPGGKINGKYIYYYLVALDGDNAMRGMIDFVVKKFCDSYIERDDKGRFVDFL